VIAVEIGADHWFYLYIPWFLPMTLIALAACEPRGSVDLRRSGYQAATVIPSEGGAAMETEPNEAQIDDPTEEDADEDTFSDDAGEEAGESGGESEAPTGP
jgi:hypothetical protein